MTTETPEPPLDSDECQAAARALIVAADRLHRAVAAASPEKGQDLLTTLRLAGAQPVVTILQVDVGTFEVHAGLCDRDTARNLSIYEKRMQRVDLAGGSLQ